MTIPATVAALMELEGVIDVKYIENTDFVANTFQPPKCISYWVTGGNKKEIAKVIYDYKYLGCATAGTSTVKVKTDFGKFEISFFHTPKRKKKSETQNSL